jgi:hypothetical protein
LSILGNILRQELQGDKAVQLEILSFVDDTHTAAAKFFDDAVVRDGSPDRENTPGLIVASSYGSGFCESANGRSVGSLKEFGPAGFRLCENTKRCGRFCSSLLHHGVPRPRLCRGVVHEAKKEEPLARMD